MRAVEKWGAGRERNQKSAGRGRECFGDICHNNNKPIVKLYLKNANCSFSCKILTYSLSLKGMNSLLWNSRDATGFLNSRQQKDYMPFFVYHFADFVESMSHVLGHYVTMPQVLGHHFEGSVWGRSKSCRVS